MYVWALTAGRLAFATIVLAAVYYLLLTVLKMLNKTGLLNGARPGLRAAARVALIVHPYVASAAFVFFPFHAYVMLTNNALGPKVFLGILLSTGILFMALSGLRLRRNPTNLKLRLVHRLVMFALAAVLLAHILA